MPTAQRLLRVLQWLLVGGWLGSWGFFAFVTARVAFTALPSAELAGAIVSPTLHALHLYGLVAGVLLVVIGLRLEWPRWLLALVVAMAIACAVTEFGVTAGLEEVRPSTFGPDTDPDAASRFRTLHALSMGIFSVVLAGVFGLATVLAWRDDSNREPARAA